MKRLLLIVMGVLLCTPLYSDMNPYIYGVTVASAPADVCATQSTTIEYTNVEGSSVALIAGVKAYGQEFTPGAIDLYSISVYVESETMETGESGTLTIRVGTANNLTTYLGEATVTIANDTFAAGFYEAVFSSPISLSAATKYSFGATWSLDDATDVIYIERTNGGSDAYGSHNLLGDASTGSWVLSSVGAYPDLTFRIKKCGE